MADRPSTVLDGIKALQKRFGEDAVMRLGDSPRPNVQVIPTGSILLDEALGIGGLPRGRIVEIAGPEQAGKCLTADTYVATADGLRTIAEIFEAAGYTASCTSRTADASVRVINRYGEQETATALTWNYRRPVYGVCLADGTILRSTARHPHLVLEDGFHVWKQTVDLRPGMFVVARPMVPCFGQGHVDTDDAYCLGVLIADGYFGEMRIAVTNDDQTVLQILRSRGPNLIGREPLSYAAGSSTDLHFNTKDGIATFYAAWGLTPTLAAGKHFPRRMREFDQETMGHLLAGYLDCEAYYAPSGTFEVTSASHELLQQVRLMLRGFGVFAVVSPKKARAYPDTPYWRLQVNGGDIAVLRDAIPFRRQFGLDAAGPARITRSIPGIARLVRAFYDSAETTRAHNRLAYDLMTGQTASAAALIQMLTEIEWRGGDPNLQRHLLALAQYEYVEITSIDDPQEEPTFDLVVPETHSFIANGIITHNTTLALHVMANAQKAGGYAAIVDAEHALDVRYAKNLGINTDELILSQPDNGEQALEIVGGLVDCGVDIVVIDSVAALVPRAELEGDMGEAQMGLQARLMSQAMRKLTGAIAKSNALVIFINQLRCVGVRELVFTDRGLIRAGDAARGAGAIAGLHGSLVPIGGSARSTQPGLRITASDGSSVTIGARHPFLTRREHTGPEWVKAADLQIGDWLATSRAPDLPDIAGMAVPNIPPGRTQERPSPLPTTATEDLCEFLGWWFADGSLCDNARIVAFSEVSRERMAALRDVSRRLGWEYRTCGTDYAIQFGSRIYRFLDVLGCERGAKNKTIPAVITGRRQWRSFLRGMVDSHICTRGLMMTSENADAARHIQVALLGFAIKARLHIHPRYGSGYLYISGTDALRYATEIGFVEPSKERQLREAVGIPDDSSRGKADVIPYPGDFIAEARRCPGWRNVPETVRGRVAAVLHADLNLSVRDYVTIADYCGIPAPLAEYRWTRVSTIDAAPETEMVDFDVPDGESFICSGFVTHNSKIGVIYGSPEVTTGGNALKFYASVRLDVRRRKAIKDGEEIEGNETDIKVIKNKLSPPFRQVTVNLIYGKGICREAELLDVGADRSIVMKAGAHYSFRGEKLGHGRDNAVEHLIEHPEVADQIEALIRLPGEEAAE